jgi:Cu/Ag efflux pump CusA
VTGARFDSDQDRRRSGLVGLQRGGKLEAVPRKDAIVVIGGLITSTALTLLVLPPLYVWVERRRKGLTT